MSLNQEYRLLLCWAKEKILDNMNVPGWSTPVLTDTHKALPKILNPVENLRDGRLFMMMLNKM